MLPTLATPLFAQEVQAPAQAEAPFKLGQELLDSALAAARPAVEKQLGHPLPEGFAGVRLGTGDEIRDALERENTPVLGAIFGEEVGREQAQAFAESLGPALLAKYVFEERAILVSAEALHRNAELLVRPELESALVVRAIVVHEHVHADDVPRYDFAGLYVRAGDPDRLQALNAVLEGHAQHVARRACAELRLSAGFDLFTQAIAAEVPEGAELGEGLRLLQRVQRETFGASYIAGERFMAAVEAKASRAGLERVLREPPRDMAEIHRPEWYLEPGLRPATRLELEGALDAFEAAYRERGWKGMRSSLDTAQLATAFNGFDEAGVKRIQSALVRGRLIQLASPDRSVVHYALACEWASAADAAFVLKTSEALLKRRDKDMQEGAVRILSAAYEPVAEEDLVGVYGLKRVKAFGDEVDVATAVLADGSLTLELLRSGEPGTKEDLLSLARRLRAAARVEAEKAAPAEPAPAAGTGGGEGG
jgi:hypothetical protein